MCLTVRSKIVRFRRNFGNLALANDPERLKPESLSSSLRQYFANDLKPKFFAPTTKAFEHGYSGDLFHGIVGLYSALSVKEDLQIGDVVDQWHDLSGQGHSFDNFSGDPKYKLSDLGNIPVIAFNGNDLLWNSHNFDELTETGYSIVSLARFTGGGSRSFHQEPEILFWLQAQIHKFLVCRG